MELLAQSHALIHCPDCGKELDPHPNYAAWCDRCDWNVNPERPKEPSGLFDRIYQAAGKRHSDKLLQVMIRQGSLSPRFSMRKLAFLCMCALVLLFSILLGTGGIVLIVVNFPNIPSIIIGTVCLLLAWTALPRWYRLRSKPLSREQYPDLYQTADEISAALGTDKVQGILIDEEFNASIGQRGWRKRKYLTLGLPLLAILDKDELAALIGHELAHGINGDLNRNSFVSSTIETLVTWHDSTKPKRILDTDDGSFFMMVCMAPVNLILLLVSKLIYVYLSLIVHLSWINSQRAEYLADRYAAEVSGKKATTSLLHKLHLHDLFEFCTSRIVNNPTIPSLLQEFRTRMGQMPAREWERIRRACLISAARLDVTHPPTGNRMAFIESLEDKEPIYRMPEERHARIKAEIEPLGPELEKKIVDQYKVRTLGW